jgi:hypothetical protein
VVTYSTTSLTEWRHLSTCVRQSLWHRTFGIPVYQEVLMTVKFLSARTVRRAASSPLSLRGARPYEIQWKHCTAVPSDAQTYYWVAFRFERKGIKYIKIKICSRQRIFMWTPFVCFIYCATNGISVPRAKCNSVFTFHSRPFQQNYRVPQKIHS